MKKSLMFVFCFILIFAAAQAFGITESASSGGSGGGGSAVSTDGNDSLRTAQVFAGINAKWWQGDFS